MVLLTKGIFYKEKSEQKDNDEERMNNLFILPIEILSISETVCLTK